jgi:acid phosphatase
MHRFFVRKLLPRVAVGMAVAAVAALCLADPDTREVRTTNTGSASFTAVPTYDHILVLLEENKSLPEIVGNPLAPYLNSLALGGASMTQSFGVAHPSEPNYLALFSGSTHGLTSDACPVSYTGENLAHQLSTAGKTFTAYSESLPSPGYTGCKSGHYRRKIEPWTDFSNVPADVSQPLSQWPTNFADLPDVSFVVPNERHDMHSGSIAVGDSWLASHIGPYAQWATSHNSLLVVTFDEDDHSAANHIATFLYGAHITPGNYAEHVTQYSMLATLQALTHLPCTDRSCSARPIRGIWH